MYPWRWIQTPVSVSPILSVYYVYLSLFVNCIGSMVGFRYQVQIWKLSFNEMLMPRNRYQAKRASLVIVSHWYRLFCGTRRLSGSMPGSAGQIWDHATLDGAPFLLRKLDVRRGKQEGGVCGMQVGMAPCCKGHPAPTDHSWEIIWKPPNYSAFQVASRP